jgi:hypothetical protein
LILCFHHTDFHFIWANLVVSFFELLLIFIISNNCIFILFFDSCFKLLLSNYLFLIHYSSDILIFLCYLVWKWINSLLQSCSVKIYMNCSALFLLFFPPKMITSLPISSWFEVIVKPILAVGAYPPELGVDQ